MSEERPPRAKKSWREIDSTRDRSGGGPARKADGGGNPRPHDQEKSKQHRAALDVLFEKGGFDKVAKLLGKEDPAAAPAAPAKAVDQAAMHGAEASAARAPVQKAVVDDGRAGLRKKIIEAIGREEITRAVDRYLAKWPLPDDWEVLEQALEHTDGARIEEAVGTLERLAGREKPRRARTLLGKLRYLEETSGDDEIRVRAAALRAKLG
ncbi:MAG: hypothetical protein EXR72_00045 [Myxococcales bacterium]|nr:hypothetical protein [Myxococcales bacterium]